MVMLFKMCFVRFVPLMAPDPTPMVTLKNYNIKWHVKMKHEL